MRATTAPAEHCSATDIAEKTAAVVKPPAAEFIRENRGLF
jgi:hypothetical protein